MGFVLGFVLFDLVFYFSIVLTGVDVVSELGWPQVLFGNLLAGVGLMVYLHHSLKVESPSWLQTLTRHRIVREGAMVGALGALAVEAEKRPPLLLAGILIFATFEASSSAYSPSWRRGC